MAWDETLLEAVTDLGSPILRTYSWQEPAATFGYSQSYAKVESWTDLRPLIRRTTGGGLVRHEADWTYCVAVPPGHWWYELKASESYRTMHEWLKQSFSGMGLDTQLAPECDPAGPGQCFVGAEKSDLLYQGQKMAGASQRRSKRGLLIQGSIQPVAPEWDRTTWESSLRATGTILHRIEWCGFNPESRQERAHHLADSTYTRDTYNRKR